MRTILSALFLYTSLFSQLSYYPEIPEALQIAAERSNYWYVSGGLAGVVPKVALGYRYQNGKLGGDLSITEAAMPFSFFSQGIQYNQLYFPRPNLGSEWYLGLSGGLHYTFGSSIGRGANLSFGALAGLQFQTNRRIHFIEAKLGLPVISLDSLHFAPSKRLLPIPSLSYGVSF